MWKTSSWTLLFFLSAVIEAKQDGCEDGTDNVIRIEDTSKGEGVIQFEDVQILTYDARKKPVCFEGQGIISLPGFVRISSGKMKVSQPINPKSALWVDLTAEQNSFFIGKICDGGESQSSFVPDDICSYDVCEFLAKDCKHLQKAAQIQLPQVFPRMIPLSAATLSQVDGEWRLEAALRQDDKLLASARAIPLKGADSWHRVRVGQEEDVEDFDKAVKEEL